MEKLEEKREFHFAGNPFVEKIHDKKSETDIGIRIHCLSQFKDTGEVFDLVMNQYYSDGIVKVGNGDVTIDEYSIENRGKDNDTWYFFDGWDIISTREEKKIKADHKDLLIKFIRSVKNDRWFDTLPKFSCTRKSRRRKGRKNFLLEHSSGLDI